MFDFLKTQKVYYAYHTDGTSSEVTATSESEAAKLAQSMQNKAVNRVAFLRNVGDPISDFERLQRMRPY
jgi:hypothetical protein